MDKPPYPHEDPATKHVQLGHHESVRSHVHQKVSIEVERLERRIEVLRVAKAPHVADMISSYERMIDRKKGLLQNLDFER